MKRSTQHRWIVAAIPVWVMLVAMGVRSVVGNSLIPGRAGESPVVWPLATVLEHSLDHYTLVVAAHPHCPCTRASLAELVTIMTSCRGRLSARVLFVEPEGFTDSWAKSELWRTAASIPEVIAVLDPLGLEARRFGAFTSGQCALYDARGRLVFAGGITGARGHEGSNTGERSVVDIIRHGQSAITSSPVFGCPLEGPAAGRGTRAMDKARPCTSS